MESLVSVLYKQIYSGHYGDTNETMAFKKWNTLPIKNNTWYK